MTGGGISEAARPTRRGRGLSLAAELAACRPLRRQRHQVVKWRKRWLVALGSDLDAVYMLGIFGIYFKTPLLHGMEPVPLLVSPSAKRLVLFVAGGLRADRFFEQESEGQFRAPFLRRVIKEKGRWVGLPCPSADAVESRSYFHHGGFL